MLLMNVINVDVVLFFFKQKTAYEITTGDWSSDVCSSDLRGGHARHDGRAAGLAWAWRRAGVEGGRDRVGEGVGLRAARDAERGAQRADPQAQRALRLCRDARLGDGARPALSASEGLWIDRHKLGAVCA